MRTLSALGLETSFHALLACLAGLGLGALFFVSPLLGLATATALTLSMIALMCPITLCYGVILGITLTSGMARGRLIPLLIPNEVILFLAFALALPFIFMKRWKTVQIPGAVIAGQAVLICGTVILPCMAYYVRGITLSSNEVLKLLAPAQYLLLFWLFLYLPQNDTERLNLVQWMWICASIVAVVGLFQAAGFTSIVELLHTWYPSSHTTVAEEIHRVTSLMGVWNGLGTFLMINLLIMRAHMRCIKTRLGRAILAIATLLCASCLLASGSYASLAGLLIGYFIIGCLDQSGLRGMGTLLITIAICMIPLQSAILNRLSYQFEGGGFVPQSILFRFKVWKDVFWPVIQENWLWGYRPTLQALAWKWSESQYFALILRSGIFSLASHLIWVFMMLVWLFRMVSTKQDLAQTLAISLVAILIVLSIMGFTNEVFTFSGSIDFVWILFGLVAGGVGVSTWKQGPTSL